MPRAATSTGPSCRGWSPRRCRAACSTASRTFWDGRGDPLVDTVSEGAIARELIHKTELHEDVAVGEARGLTGPYRTLTCDCILRPIGFGEVKDPYVLEGFWKQ